MTNLHFSVALPEYLPEAETFFNRLVSPVLSRDNISLITDAVPWEQLWHVIQTKTLSKSGIDVSEVGTTWLGSLADANSLRPFSEKEVEILGGRDAFTSSAFRGTGLAGDDRVLSIPWLTDTRVIYYWRDMLDRVDLEGTSAFSTPRAFRRTMEALKNAGIPPWGAVTFPCNNTVHQAASWIWATGKDFISDDGKRTAFYEPESLQAIQEYFGLYQYMPSAFDSFDHLHQTFKSRQVACVMDGPWLLNRLLRDGGPKAVNDLGVALPPGPPFIGGSNLVIWHHVSDETAETALRLVKCLVSDQIQSKVSAATGLLPVRNEALKQRPYTTDPRYDVLLAAEARGRRLPRITIWGPLELSLVNAFANIWKRIKDRGFGDVDETVRRHLEPLAKRFDRLLEIF